jgi:hypothetical protein
MQQVLLAGVLAEFFPTIGVPTQTDAKLHAAVLTDIGKPKALLDNLVIRLRPLLARLGLTAPFPPQAKVWSANSGDRWRKVQLRRAKT